MINYQVRSKDLLDMVNEIKSKRLIMSPYFQRNLVWRTIHKVDFIKTILHGYPIPQIFIAKGSIDLENMQAISCIVDGQQRMSSIFEFIKDEYPVDGQVYSQLTPGVKEAFLRYQIPIIDLDLAHDDNNIIEIFKRLNRTFYSLSSIEKYATEYAPSEYMLVAKLLIREFKVVDSDNEEDELLPLQNDPNVPQSFVDWAQKKKVQYYPQMLNELGIFSQYELSRKVHLMFTLNVMTTIKYDFYNRNDFATKYLDEFANNFDEKDIILEQIEFAAKKLISLKLNKKSYWLNKSNAFSLLVLFGKRMAELQELPSKTVKDRLEVFETSLPPEYKLFAKEGVNNRKERLYRNEQLERVILNQSSSS